MVKRPALVGSAQVDHWQDNNRFVNGAAGEEARQKSTARREMWRARCLSESEQGAKPCWEILLWALSASGCKQFECTSRH